MDPRTGQQSGGREEDPLAYGDYPQSSGSRFQEGGAFDEGAEGERGLIGDTYRKVRDKYMPQYDGSSQSKPSGGLGSFLFGKLQGVVQEIGSGIDQKLGGTGPKHSHTHAGAQCDDGMHHSNQHRYGSFAAQRTGNDAKWYVDGCGYMWAVSRALEQATESIWILDCEDCMLYAVSPTNRSNKGGCHRSCTSVDLLRTMSSTDLTVCYKQPLNVVSRSISSFTRR